jgi:hypothetical protein
MSSPRDVFRHLREAIKDNPVAAAYIQTVTEELEYEYERIPEHWRGHYSSRNDADLERYRKIEMDALHSVACSLMATVIEDLR